METTEQGKRGGNRKGIFRSYEAWEKDGKPDGFLFDHQTGRGHVKTAEERKLDTVKERRFEMKNRRSTWRRRQQLQEIKEQLTRR